MSLHDPRPRPGGLSFGPLEQLQAVHPEGTALLWRGGAAMGDVRADLEPAGAWPAGAEEDKISLWA